MLGTLFVYTGCSFLKKRVVSLFLIMIMLISCQFNKNVTKLNNSFLPITGIPKKYQTITKQYESLKIENLSENAVLMSKAQIDVISMIPISDGDMLFLICDGNLESENSQDCIKINNNRYRFSFDTLKMRNGLHTVQPWFMKRNDAGVETCYLGKEQTIYISNEYLKMIDYTDPEGDDHGQNGDLSLPINGGADGSYVQGVNDILCIQASCAGGNLSILIRMKKISTAWSPDNGFDHNAFFIFLNDPIKKGKTFMPKQQSQLPEGIGNWDYLIFVHGWGKDIFSSEDSGEDRFGASKGSPVLVVDEAKSEIEMRINSDALDNPSSMEGWQIYIATFDYDGLTSSIRKVCLTNDLPDHQYHSSRSDYFDRDGRYLKAYVIDDIVPQFFDGSNR